MDFKSAIFDLDGTILDNNDIYIQAFREVLKEIGGKTLNEPLPLRGSIGIAPNWPALVEKYHLVGKDIADLTRKTQDEYLKNLGRVTVRKGFLEFVQKLVGNKVKTAIATSNERETVELCLQRFGLKKYFEKVVCLEDVEKLKPAPDLFFEAAERLSSFPIDCMVFEDAKAGIEAAHKAGMRVCCFVYENGKEDTSQADITFTNYFELADKIF